MVPTMSDAVHTGSCLCGGVSYEVRGDFRPVSYCHCEQCRKTSGNFVGATACEIDALHMLSETSLTWYRASDTARRGFCSVCGGNVFWAPDHRNYISIFAGTVDMPTGLVAENHIYVADKADYVDIGDGLPQFPQNDI